MALQDGNPIVFPVPWHLIHWMTVPDSRLTFIQMKFTPYTHPPPLNLCSLLYSENFCKLAIAYVWENVQFYLFSARKPFCPSYSLITNENFKFQQGLPRWPSGKESTSQAGNIDLITRMGRSFGEGNSNSDILAWEIPRTEEPGRQQYMGSPKSQPRLGD